MHLKSELIVIIHLGQYLLGKSKENNVFFFLTVSHYLNFTLKEKWFQFAIDLLIQHFLHFLPFNPWPAMQLPRQPESLFWWVDGQFLPYDDSTIVQSVGAYEARTVGTPLVITKSLHGFIYFFKFKQGKSSKSSLV